MINRRKALSNIALLSSSAMLSTSCISKEKSVQSEFRFCLNTSTISGKSPGILKYIEIAAEAGYDGIEVWIRDIKTYLDEGNSLASLKKYIDDRKLRVENAIGFAPWISGGTAGFEQMEKEMTMLAGIGCKRIAAPPAGVPEQDVLDLIEVGKKYKSLLDLGRMTGVMPQLEFWGASPVLWNLGQVLMIAAAADDPDVKILPDIYHMFRGESGFNSLKMLNGNMIDVFHMNDYPATRPREQQNDSDRVYPGDGVAPMQQILTDLMNMGGPKILSLELFNRSYWEEDPLEVARTGLDRMKSLVREIA